MAINKKLIHFSKGENYDIQKNNGNILDSSICFIQDRKTIATHGTEYKMIGWSELLPPPDGIYAISSTGLFIDYNLADTTATGVVLIAGEHKFMIAKSDATDGTNTTFYWTKSFSDLSLNNYTKVNGTNNSGHLPKPDGTFSGSTHLSDDFTTWTAGALSDFNGKANTAIIAEASSNVRDMCTILNTFNASDNFKDWYVPACGQLALIYLNMTKINTALENIGGTPLAADFYWSSSEYSIRYAWYIVFNNGYVDDFNGKDKTYRVRFIRDI